MELGRTKKILLAVIILILVAAAGAFIYFQRERWVFSFLLGRIQKDEV